MSGECEGPGIDCPCSTCALGRLFVSILEHREGKVSKAAVNAAFDAWQATRAPVGPTTEDA